MGSAKISLPLYERISLKSSIKNAFDIIILTLLLSILLYRLLSLTNHGFSWVLAFLCELWFTFCWLMIMNIKWSRVRYKTYQDRLLQRVAELPPVDVFVTTADPVLEPPIITINTVLSLLAVDYPAHKLACYVSDDGCSPLILYSLIQASNFAKQWIPFCKKYNIQLRAPFRYFSNRNYSTSSRENSKEFLQEWKLVKDEYEKLYRKIENAAKKPTPCELSGEFEAFADIERRNHPTIIKVIWENKERLSGGLPHLIYISREKHPKHPHHYKAGAMNVLTRVSGLMTNAPYMLNVDCDMHANNPKLFLHAMCFLLNSKGQNDLAFVQFPQIFYDGLKDDPFGNQFVVLFEYMGKGAAGLQGAFYAGTGCFHRRKVIYGASPYDKQTRRPKSTAINENMTGEELVQVFGSSKEFVETAADALKEQPADHAQGIRKSIEAAYQVAGCGYEYGSSWGSKAGWIYGSTSEDIQTGLSIHARGWKSVIYFPEPPAFLGCAPTSGPDSLTQQKRWATGLLEILISKNCPIIHTLFGNLQFRQCLAYLYLLCWGFCSIPELCYAILPAYCLITNSNFLPKLDETACYIPIALFVIFNLYNLQEYIATSQSIRAWWNNQRMGRIISTSAWFFGVIRMVLKLLGISETVFEVTQKDQFATDDDNDGVDARAGRFTFDKSPIFVPVTTILLVQLTSLAIGLLGLRPPADGGQGSGPLEIVCSVWLVLCLWPFLKGMFGKGKYGIPLSTISKSSALALPFVYLCRRSTQMG
ncbi:cellulose synthase-like protein H1 [Ziziphus jujuba]|uniref:Cellulose synthase-like protein H1 n=1 Tax=Ziziphus jujuba TaxID=326968 RepID=A0ABM4A5Z8_ZIZJJ|nr:cellulose synthase-like protein H1 [Ziziphus jujuba]